MSKKTKDALITKEEAQAESNSNKPSLELLRLFELVNEIPIEYPGLPSSRMISDKLFSEGLTSRFPQFDDEEFFNLRTFEFENGNALFASVRRLQN